MNQKALVIILLFFFSTAANAQLNGTYTIGTSGTYSSFSSAITALNSQGVNGNVVFNVSPGTYTEFFTINNYTGNTQYSVTFKSVGSDSTSVILQNASSTSASNNFVVKFNGAKNIVFSYMTIQRTGNSDFSQVVEILNNSSDLSFKSLIIKNNSTSLADNSANLFTVSNLNSSNTQNTTIENCKFVNGAYGVFIQGMSSGTLANNLEIKRSIFENQYRTSVYTAYQNSLKILDNKIYSQSTYSTFRAIEFLYCNLGSQISRNQIDIVKGHALFLANSQGFGSPGQIFNNFIAVGGTGATAILLSSSGTFNIYFNSINLYGSNAVGFNVTGSTSANIRFANNILNSDLANKLMVVATSTNTPFDYCNYNNYRTSGMIGDWKATTNISTLASWRTASSLDALSISANPNFVSNTNLRIQNSLVQRAGTSALNAPVPNTDINGSSRHIFNPDMGAFELSFDDLALSSLIFSTSSCVNIQNAVKIVITNHSNYTVSVTNIPLKYSYKGNTITEYKSISNLAPNDSIEHIFNTKISSNIAGNFPVSSWISFTGDIDNSNDSATSVLDVYNYPTINLPLDTTICSNNSVVLDAGAGYNQYLWSTGDTTQTISLSVSDLGLGGSFVSVRVWKAQCVGRDSTLVIFKNCAGFDDNAHEDLVAIYPNPANNTLFISSLQGFQIQYWSLFDFSGKEISRNRGSLQSIDISFLQKGIYFLVLESDNQIIRKTFIKN